MTFYRPTFTLGRVLTIAAAITVAALTAGPALAQDVEAIRKNLAAQFPQLERIDEIGKSPMANVFEVRIGTEVFYTDGKGEYLLQGELLDVKNKRNLTEERVAKLTAIDFDSLPLADAFTIVRGTGKRKMAVFEDPNCGYCKRFEADLQKVDNVTIHMFLYPILGQDSIDKSRAIWCAKDRGVAWQDWMLRDKAPKTAACDAAALQRNVAFGKKNRINGTPMVLFGDGTRVPGAIPAAEIEKNLGRVKS